MLCCLHSLGRDISSLALQKHYNVWYIRYMAIGGYRALLSTILSRYQLIDHRYHFMKGALHCTAMWISVNTKVWAHCMVSTVQSKSQHAHYYHWMYHLTTMYCNFSGRWEGWYSMLTDSSKRDVDLPTGKVAQFKWVTQTGLQQVLKESWLWYFCCTLFTVGPHCR